MLVVKAFHIISMVAWFSGLFYLPRLYVYHASSEDDISIERFKTMERRLYYGITWPAGLFTTALGLTLLTFNPDYYLRAGWMHAKIALVLVLWFYHLSCGRFRKLFAHDKNCKSALFFRIFNEIPTLLLILIVLLAVVRPF
ncbi:protoporphyrinogen oxidase HemJ [Legionella londiniensis]|uniref:Protoporphyrinogen IX oxidase n=1 Tax=Legionella londiniensis TaxID=45068 RepID=A0A0W0VLW6_9GAMM|nr:protoporphyrinogen oxidase HemJ [Legionella londiniensis]KTD21052.1 transmembrane protein [Legionella londiniensis]STX93117.1 transmembrane protein [Legionella londiniensis]